jgi:4-hydroxythreonine-4-phosphate dehydrogenase
MNASGEAPGSKRSEEASVPRVGISCGDLHGVGLEVVLKTFSDGRMLQDMTAILYCNSKVVSAHRKALKLDEAVPYHKAAHAAEAQPRKLNVVSVWEEEVVLELGKPSGGNSAYALRSLEAAAQDLASGNVDVLVTAPIDKHSMQAAGFAFPGHTEYLAHMAGGDTPVLMLLVAEGLRVGTVTGHVPLRDVPQAITTAAVVLKARLFHESLVRDFGVAAPRIAVLGLNPHAGDNGTLGAEDRERILPAVRQLKEEGIAAMGPYAADGFFGSGTFAHFDGVLAMYHDQGLAPFKALSFGRGVNYTAGLPVVRTSPDHGTALDIAGQGLADESSFRHAVWLACDVRKQRERHKQAVANPLQPQKKAKGREV